MSMVALTWVRRCGAAPTVRLVLYALADMANDDGECWPSIASLVERTGLGERAIQTALAGLVSAGTLAVERGGGRGRTNLYRFQYPAPGAETPQEKPRFSRNPAAETPFLTTETPHLTTETPQQMRETPQQMHPKPQEANEASGKPERGRRGSRLPADWQPTQDDADYAQKLRLDPHHVAEQFRDYWHAKAGQNAAKLDWPATWRVWCRREAERVPHGQRAPPPRSKLAWMLEPQDTS
jgi:pyocin large subunit-like protein